MIVTSSKIETVISAHQDETLYIQRRYYVFNRIGISQEQTSHEQYKKENGYTYHLPIQRFFFSFFLLLLVFKVEEKHQRMCQRSFCLQLIPASSFLQQKSKEKTNQPNYKLQIQCPKRTEKTYAGGYWPKSRRKLDSIQGKHIIFYQFIWSHLDTNKGPWSGF